MIRIMICTLIIFFLSASCVKENYLKINKTLDYPIFHDELLKDKSYSLNYGLANIVHIGSMKENLYSDSCRFCCYSKFVHDTLMFVFNSIDLLLKIEVFNGKFESHAIYSTDIMHTYPQGEYVGTYFDAPIKVIELILNKNRFFIGDTIKGYINLITFPFLYRKFGESNKYVERIDSLSGPFIMMVESNMPRLF